MFQHKQTINHCTSLTRLIRPFYKTSKLKLVNKSMWPIRWSLGWTLTWGCLMTMLSQRPIASGQWCPYGDPPVKDQLFMWISHYTDTQTIWYSLDPSSPSPVILASLWHITTLIHSIIISISMLHSHQLAEIQVRK